VSKVLADPAEMIAHGAPRVIQKNLKQRDLISEFGSESAVSMFLAGQRNLTIEQVRRLSARFKLPADAFIAKARGAKA